MHRQLIQNCIYLKLRLTDAIIARLVFGSSPLFLGRLRASGRGAARSIERLVQVRGEQRRVVGAEVAMPNIDTIVNDQHAHVLTHVALAPSGKQIEVQARVHHLSVVVLRRRKRFNYAPNSEVPLRSHSQASSLSRGDICFNRTHHIYLTLKLPHYLEGTFASIGRTTYISLSSFLII